MKPFFLKKSCDFASAGSQKVNNGCDFASAGSQEVNNGQDLASAGDQVPKSNVTLLLQEINISKL